MRSRYQQNRDVMTGWIMKYFPPGTRVSQPRGGFMLWIELDEEFDTLRLNRHLEKQGVQIAVGSIFSASGKYRNCLRINYAYAPKLMPEIEQAVLRVGATIQQLILTFENTLAQSD
ncbi:putative HTH-type transcriptional regulator YjiR [compost metagenome]